MDNQDVEAGAAKFDGDKIRTDLVPPDAILAVASVFTYGAMKYDEWNWTRGMRAGRLVAAMERHMAAYKLGEECDPESGMPHLWHAGCCILMLIAGYERDVVVEDRCPSPHAHDNVLRQYKRMSLPVKKD